MRYLLESVGILKTKPGAQVVLAEFKDPGDLLHAAEKVHDAGYREYDAHSPFPIHGMDKAMGLKPSMLGVLVFFAGAAGLSVALIMQGWTSAIDYPTIISGKPFFSLPAFIPIAFELTILFSAFATVFGMFAMNQLPRFHHPVFYSEHFAKASDDGFFISIEGVDPLFDEEKSRAFLESIGGTNVEVLLSDD